MSISGPQLLRVCGVIRGYFGLVSQGKMPTSKVHYNMIHLGQVLEVRVSVGFWVAVLGSASTSVFQIRLRFLVSCCVTFPGELLNIPSIDWAAVNTLSKGNDALNFLSHSRFREGMVRH